MKLFVGNNSLFQKYFDGKKKDVCYFIVLISKKHLGHRAEVIILVTFFNCMILLRSDILQTDWLEFKSVNQEK